MKKGQKENQEELEKCPSCDLVVTLCEKNKVLRKQLAIAVKGLNKIAHIGVVMDDETGQEFECNPIQVAQECLTKIKSGQDE